MFLSVVIPTFNRRDSLRVTLDALARQDYPPDRFEVVVVSDGATDGTDEMLSELAGPGSPFAYCLRPVTQPNAGPSRARNQGIAQARGEVIVLLDDDVEPLPSFLSRHAARHVGSGGAASDDADTIVVIGPMLPDPARRDREPLWIAWEHAMLVKQYDCFTSGLWPGAGPNHFYSGNASLRRAHLQAVGGFDETFKRQEDVELAYRLERERGLRFRFDPEAAGLHRPQRSFASWRAVPFAYGQLDVVRAQRGHASWEAVRHGYIARNAATRHLMNFSLLLPGASELLAAALLGLAQAADRLHRRKTALAVLSALYNLRYMEGAKSALGGDDPRQLRRLLRHGETPPAKNTGLISG